MNASGLCMGLIIVLLLNVLPIETIISEAIFESHDGNTVMNGVREIVYYNSTTIYLTSNLTINSSTRYVYDNSLVVFNCSSDGDVVIRIRSGGELIIRNGTRLTINRTGNFSNNCGYNYRIIAEKGGKLRIENSNISYAGYGDREYSGVVVYANNTVIENSTFYRCYYGIYFYGSSYSTVQNNTFRYILKHGIVYDSPFSSYGMVTHNLLRKNRFIGLGDSAVTFGLGIYSSGVVTYSNITENQFINCRAGIFCNLSIYISITENSFRNCLYGVKGSTISYIVIVNNTIKGGMIGIDLENVDKATIQNNTIMNFSSSAISLFSVLRFFSVTIRSNSIIKCNEGIHMRNCDNITVVDNVIKDCARYGIYQTISDYYSYTYIRGNILVNNTYGIYYTVTSHGIAERNEIIDSRVCGIYAHNLDNLTLSNNTLGGGGAGIKITSSADVVIVDCNVTDAVEGVNITSSKRILYYWNSVENTTRALSLLYTQSGRFQESVFNNSGVGVYVNDRCSGLMFTKNQFNRNVVHATDETSSQWDHGGYGNYWSDVEEYHDWDGNGIVDDPYVIDENSIDHYPLIKPWGQPYNRGIRLTSIPANGTVVGVGKWFNYSFTAEDPDGDAPWYVLHSNPQVSFSLNNTTGFFSYMPREDDVGRVNFTVVVYDGNGSRDVKLFYLHVIPPNHPPVVEMERRVRVVAGDRGRVYLNISDLDGDDVSVSIYESETPFELHLYYEEYIWFVTDEGDEGVYHVILKVTDNNGSTLYVDFVIVVMAPNIPPTVEDIGDQECYVGEEFVYRVEAHDPNPDDSLSYRMEYSGVGEAAIDENGVIRIVPAEEDLGEQRVVVWVSDNNGSEVMVEFRLIVLLRNSAPVGKDRYNVVVCAGEVVVMEMDVEDPDGDRLVVCVGGELPRWVDVDNLTLVFHPSIEDVGEYDLVLNISDDRGGYLSVRLHVVVVEGEVPEVSMPDRVVLREREEREVPFRINYSGNGSVYLRYVGEKDWCRVEEDRIILTPVDGDAGVYVLRFEVGLVGGVRGEVEMVAEVYRNLTGLRTEVMVVPYRDEYDVGEVVELRVVWSGYEGEIVFRWAVECDGVVLAEVNGSDVRIKLEKTGVYVVKLYVVGEDEEWDKIVLKVVGEKREERGYVRWVVWGVVLVAVLIALVLVLLRSGKLKGFTGGYRKW